MVRHGAFLGYVILPDPPNPLDLPARDSVLFPLMKSMVHHDAPGSRRIPRHGGEPRDVHDMGAAAATAAPEQSVPAPASAVVESADTAAHPEPLVHIDPNVALPGHAEPSSGRDSGAPTTELSCSRCHPTKSPPSLASTMS
ncbi:hypothetical protein MTO96_036616 [Rhipicephalus appendiculatus]